MCRTLFENINSPLVGLDQVDFDDVNGFVLEPSYNPRTILNELLVEKYTLNKCHTRFEDINYRRCTGFGPLFQLQSKIKNMQRLKCNIFFTPTFELKFLLSIAPIVKNGVQLEVGFFLKKPWGPKSYAEHLTWAPQNFHSINYILFFA